MRARKARSLDLRDRPATEVNEQNTLFSP